MAAQMYQSQHQIQREMNGGCVLGSPPSSKTYDHVWGWEESCWVSRQSEPSALTLGETQSLSKILWLRAEINFSWTLIRYQNCTLWMISPVNILWVKNWEQSPGSSTWTGREERQTKNNTFFVIMEQTLLASKIVSMFILGLLTWIIGIVPMVSVRKGIIMHNI